MTLHKHYIVRSHCPYCVCRCRLLIQTEQRGLSVGAIAHLKGHYFQPSLSVSLYVCLCVSDRHFYPSVLTDFDETRSQGVRDPTVIQFGRDHNGPDRPQRDCATPFENFRKISKITEFEFPNSGPSFFAYVSPVYCKKNSTRFKQN